MTTAALDALPHGLHCHCDQCHAAACDGTPLCPCDQCHAHDADHHGAYCPCDQCEAEYSAYHWDLAMAGIDPVQHTRQTTDMVRETPDQHTVCGEYHCPSCKDAAEWAAAQPKPLAKPKPVVESWAVRIAHGSLIRDGFPTHADAMRWAAKHRHPAWGTYAIVPQ